MQLLSSTHGGSRSGLTQMGGSKTGLIYLLCIIGLGAVAGLLFVKNQSIKTELEKSTALASENETLKRQVGELEQMRTENQGLQASRKESQDELLRLRSEVNVLRSITNQLAKLTAENVQLKNNLQKVQSTVADANVLRNQNQQLQGALAAQQLAQQAAQQAAQENAGKAQCTQNLRAIQAAKQAWAQDNARPGSAIPADAELFGPNRYMPQKPVCPGGGAYTIGAVQQNPICTVPGHVP